MDKKNIIKYILAWVIISFIINYFSNKKLIINENGTVLRIDNNTIISNKPINIDISLLENKINKEFELSTVYHEKDTKNISLKKNDNIYVFSTYTGSPIIYKYIHPIIKKELTAFDYSINQEILPPLSIIINNTLITDFNIDETHENKDSIIFYKKHNGYTVIRKYILKNNIIECEIIIDNPNNETIGSIQIVSEEQLLLNKDLNEGAFNYNDDEKIIKFSSQNDLILNQSVILNPEIVGLQSNFLTQAFIKTDNSFERAFFKKNNSNNIMYFLESKVINTQMTILSFNWYIGPKIYSTLNSIDSRLALIMEYGLFSKISQFLMSLIFILTSLFSNFGIALLVFIALTKAMLIPFAKGMKENNKKNKEFQQKLEYIKAKYHDDPEKKSTEEIALFKKYGMFSGITSKIPQFLNIFILFSLQSILKKNIMLYKVPLGLWLTDASMPDKYYILPIIAIIFMYLTINKTKMAPMLKIALLIVMLFFIYMLSFWSSSIQLFIVAGIIAGYIENTYLLT